VAQALLGVEMRGNLMGYKVVGLQKDKGTTGLLRNHLLTTGLEFLYEGITIATSSPTRRSRRSSTARRATRWRPSTTAMASGPSSMGASHGCT
jgi:hypothetical protein